MTMNKMSLTTGSIGKGLALFSFPMVIINILQMLFHAADTAVLGMMSGDAEVAAVGACGSLVSLLVCLVSGYASAANVVISRRVGTFDTSIEPYEDCCTVFTPRHPRTRPDLNKVLEQERRLPFEELCEEALAGMYRVDVTPEGYEIRE